MQIGLLLRSAVAGIMLYTGVAEGESVEKDVLLGHPNRIVLQPGECASTVSGEQLRWFCAAAASVAEDNAQTGASEAQLRAARESADAALTENARLQQQLDEARDALAAARAAHQVLESQAAETSAKAQRSDAQLQSSLQSLESRLAEATQDKDRLAAELAVTKAQADKMHTELEQSRLAFAQSQAQQRDAVDALQSRLDAAMQKNQELSAQSQQASAQFETLRLASEQSQEELLQQQAQQQDNIETLKAKLDAASKQTTGLRAQLKTSMAKAQAAMAEHEQIQQGIEQDKRQIEAQLREALQDYNKALDVIRSHESDAEERGRQTLEIVARNTKLEQQITTHRRLLGDADQDGVVDILDLCGASAQGAPVDETGCVDETDIVLQGVRFNLNSAKLTAGSRRILDNFAAQLAQHADLRFEVGGHTDSTGDAAYNLDISLRRAHTVRDYLIAKGVAGNRLVAAGYGQKNPIADNGSFEGRSQNRRVALRRMR